MRQPLQLAEALATAFGFQRAGRGGPPAGRWARYTRPGLGRSRLTVRPGGIALRHERGWRLVVSANAQDELTTAEVSGTWLDLAEVRRLQRADRMAGGLLRGALQRGQNAQSRRVQTLMNHPGPTP